MDLGVHNVQWTQVSTMYNRKTVYFTRSLLELARRILYTTTLTIETYFYVPHSRHSYN